MPKRPMGFPNPNFVQGQVSVSAPGTPGGGANQQLQSSQAMTHTGKKKLLFTQSQTFLAKIPVTCDKYIY